MDGQIDWIKWKNVADYSGVDTVNILSANAYDTSGGGSGIQAGDTVKLIFDAQTQSTTITKFNIDSALGLSSSHTWLDGLGNIGSAIWSTTSEFNDTLTITLSTAGGAPDVAVGDTITLDGTIKDTAGLPIIDSEMLGGSF